MTRPYDQMAVTVYTSASAQSRGRLVLGRGAFVRIFRAGRFECPAFSICTTSQAAGLRRPFWRRCF